MTSSYFFFSIKPYILLVYIYIGACLLVTCIYVGDICMLIISVDDYISILPDYYKALSIIYLIYL